MPFHCESKPFYILQPLPVLLIYPFIDIVQHLYVEKCPMPKCTTYPAVLFLPRHDLHLTSHVIHVTVVIDQLKIHICNKTEHYFIN